MSSEDLDERPSQRKLVFEGKVKEDTVIRDSATETTPRMLNEESRPPLATGNYFEKKQPPRVAQSIEKRQMGDAGSFKTASQKVLEKS